MRTVIAFVVLAFFIGCGGGKQTRDVADVTKPETITLKKGRSQGDIHYITVAGTGYLDGAAEIVLILDGKPYKTESLSGNVDFTWNGDWYSDSAQIEYKPSSVKKGNLSLRYKFKDM